MQAVLRSFGEAVAAVNSTAPGAPLRLLLLFLSPRCPCGVLKTADRQYMLITDLVTSSRPCYGKLVSFCWCDCAESVVKYQQLGKVAAYTTWLADPSAVDSKSNGTVKLASVRRSDLITFPGISSSYCFPTFSLLVALHGCSRCAHNLDDL